MRLDYVLQLNYRNPEGKGWMILAPVIYGPLDPDTEYVQAVSNAQNVPDGYTLTSHSVIRE
jgi:hypothetical protein